MDLPEEELIELKRLMAKFHLERPRNKADETWDQKAYSDEKLNGLTNG